MSKRAKFFGVALFLGFALWLTGTMGVEKRLGLVLSISAMAYVLSAWVLFEDLKGWEWITLMILPVMFTLGFGSFINLLPPAIPSVFGLSFQIETSIFLASVVRVLATVLYSLGMYTILLTENIFSVASIRTIQLFRAARSWSFIMELVTGMFFFVLAFSLKLPFFWVMLIVGLVSLLLAFGGLWSIDLKMEHLDEVYRLSGLVAWLMVMYAASLSFWPIRPFMGGLVLTSCFYALVGVLEQRLLNKMVILNHLEFVIFNLIVVLTAFFTTSWRG